MMVWQILGATITFFGGFLPAAGSGHFELVDALACWRFLQSSGAPPFFIFLNRIFTICEL